MNFSVDLVSAFQQSDILGKFIVILLLITSIISWCFIFYKWFFFKLCSKEGKNFYKNYYKEPQLRRELFLKSLKYAYHPIPLIYQRIFSDYEWKKDNGEKIDMNYFETEIDNLKEYYIHKLESYLIILATVANISPLIGLFGTVWGILGVFQKLGLLGSAEFVTLAPGISTALLTTVAGLFAAIPAVFFYNKFLKTIENISIETDNFCANLLLWIEKEILENKEELS